MIISAWTKHLKTEEEKQKFQSSLLGDKIILGRLKQLLEEKEADLDRSEKTLASYDNPNWAYKQAHRNGFSSAISAIKQLIDLDNREN